MLRTPFGTLSFLSLQASLLLPQGVPLGIGQDSIIPACPVMPLNDRLPAQRPPLQCCTSAWQSALKEPEAVDALLKEELREGWIRLVPGDVAYLRKTYTHCAVGKLGLVRSAGRSDRLVVDSSVSGVTDNTQLPNRSSNPTLNDVRSCLPLSDSAAPLSALVLDVSKAHRRILIRPADQGLLCFHHRGQLYQCLTLNFGARASGFYWSRVSGLLVRLLHRLVWLDHSMMIYVDDLLSLFDQLTAPLWASTCF